LQRLCARRLSGGFAPRRAELLLPRAASDRTETKRERYIGNFVFTIRDHVPNSFIPVNPLGLTITYFREDQAFQ